MQIFFNFPVNKEAKKYCIKDELYWKLVQAGILLAKSGVGGKAASVESISIPGKGSDSSCDTSMLLKELDLEFKKQEHETTVKA